MKKLIAGLAASFMLAAGLVTVSSSVSPASAACAQTKYNARQCPTPVVKKPKGLSNTVGSATKIKRNTAKSIPVTFTAPRGVKATVTVKVVRVVGKTTKKVSSKTVKNVKAGSKKTIKTPKLKKKGTYQVTVTITPKGSKAAKTTRTYFFKVR